MNQPQGLPFFLLGCSWSGNSVIRNALKLHPSLFAPESTYVYRWSEPFSVNHYASNYLGNKDLKKNWFRDGFTRAEVKEVLGRSKTRLNVLNQYGRRFLRKKGAENKRWFDATPENIYGLLLIRAHYPDSKIVYVYKNAYEVVASLMFSPRSEALSIEAAVNHWLEAMQIINIYKQLPRPNLIELRYESFVIGF